MVSKVVIIKWLFLEKRRIEIMREGVSQGDSIVQSQHSLHLCFSCEHKTRFCEYHSIKAKNRVSVENYEIELHRLFGCTFRNF